METQFVRAPVPHPSHSWIFVRFDFTRTPRDQGLELRAATGGGRIDSTTEPEILEPREMHKRPNFAVPPPGPRIDGTGGQVAMKIGPVTFRF
ncbi:hypothetical protein N7462_011452 [Penicillium macrosclerotiorum]|uniref:uncharacterized protein n=1 Tax=Penicillium macrosclerotiorum TaxID=303699 RepID=UPI00254765C3|nr:uncharacterized protein N7462_011452 [Penicillium macrosclerotiorum]KAJ5664639.1 hypothetical protein N7462_011452 [Penicillium macrosclerotiorum]